MTAVDKTLPGAWAVCRRCGRRGHVNPRLRTSTVDACDLCRADEREKERR
jgi:hypothetical protein